MKLILLSTLLFIGFISCKSKKATTQTVQLENSSWEVISLSNNPVETKQTLIFTGEKVNGQAACNNYSGSVVFGEDNSIKFNAMLRTKRGCEKLNEESLLFNNMEKITSFQMSKTEELSLLNAEKKVVIKLKKIQ